MSLKRILATALLSLLAIGCATSARAAWPYTYGPSYGRVYGPVRYPFGAPNYYAPFYAPNYYADLYRPYYIAPYRYAYYYHLYGWSTPRYYRPYAFYGPWCNDPPVVPWGTAWFGPVNMAPAPYVIAAPGKSKYAGCEYW
jgi:hypothetical protein